MTAADGLRLQQLPITGRERDAAPLQPYRRFGAAGYGNLRAVCRAQIVLFCIAMRRRGCVLARWSAQAAEVGIPDMRCEWRCSGCDQLPARDADVSGCGPRGQVRRLPGLKRSLRERAS
jgi:hypothetical protein